MGTYLQTHGGVPLDHPRRCTAHRQDGKPCRRYAARGANVCRVHGGAAPQVVAKARERLALAADRMARELLGIAISAESEAVKLAAVKDALDRAGLGAKTEVELSTKPYEDIMADITGIAIITRAESRARRGLPDEPALAEPAYEIVDAELVDDGPEMGPIYTEDGPEAPEPTGVADDAPATPSGHVGRELATLEDAAADADAGNRRAKAGRVRRVC